jgi:hypothetical protein
MLEPDRTAARPTVGTVNWRLPDHREEVRALSVATRDAAENTANRGRRFAAYACLHRKAAAMTEIEPPIEWNKDSEVERLNKIIGRQNLEIMRLRKDVERLTYALAVVQAKLKPE